MKKLNIKKIYESVLSEKDQNDEKEKSSSVKDPKGQILSGLKGMKPGAIMQAVSKSLGTTSAEFLKSHLIKIVVAAAKAGKVKASAIKDAIKDFKDKNAEDNSKIDWEHVEVDPSGVTVKCLFDGDTKKHIDSLVAEITKNMDGVKEEIEQNDKKFRDTAKKAKIDMSDDELDENGVTVANVLADKKVKAKDKNDTVKDQLKAKAELKKQIDALQAKLKKLDGIKLPELDEKTGKPLKESLLESILTESDNPVSLDNMAAAVAIRAAEMLKNNKDVMTNDEALESVMKWVSDAANEMNYDSDLTNELCEKTELIFNTAIEKSKDLTSVAKEFTNDTAMKVADKLMSISPEDDEFSIDAFSYKEVKHLAKQVSKGITGEIEDLMSTVQVNGNKISGFQASAVLDKTSKALGMSKNDLAKVFAKSSSTASKNMALDKMTLKMTKFLVDYEKNPSNAVKQLTAGLNSSQKDVMSEIICKMKPDAVSHFKDAGIDINGTIDNMSNNTATNAAKAVAKAAVDSNGNIFDYASMDKQFDKIEDIFDDGRITPQELKQLNSFNSRLMDYQVWAANNANSTDPAIKQKIAQITLMSKKFNEFETDHFNEMQALSDKSEFGIKNLPPEGKKVTGKLVNSEEGKKAVSGWKKAFGLDKAFTAIGIARLAAKTTGVLLNNGKSLVDALGAQAVKYKEDKTIIAKMNCIISNGEGSDSKFDDTKFSVRFDVNDCKWHATCLDNRKMKFPEDKLVSVVLNSDIGKKFKSACISKWKDIFRPDDEKKSIIPFLLANIDKLGFKTTKLDKNFIQTLKLMKDKFDKIEAEFK